MALHQLTVFTVHTETQVACRAADAFCQVFVFKLESEKLKCLLFVGMEFLLTCSFISKACDLADRLGLSFVVLLSLLTDLDFLSSFFDGILGSILRLTALILLAVLS